MKNVIYLLSFLFVFSLNAQKNKNGVIYDKHPGIDLITTFHSAQATGDLEKAAEILHDDMQWVDGNNNERIWGGKQRVLNNINWFKNYFDYVSFNDTEGAYPDYVETKRSGNWVYSWFNVYGIHKNTGVKLDHPVLRLYALSEDNSKILRIIEYSNKIEFNRIWDARPQTSRENGKIYINHDNINSVRKAMYSFFNGDMDKAWSFFHENATFEDINETKVMSTEEIKARDAEIFGSWDLVSLDESGYPDYLEYDWRDSKVVQSWWNMKFSRKSDKKTVDVKVLFLDDFDNEGKIIKRYLYWNKSLLN